MVNDDLGVRFHNKVRLVQVLSFFLVPLLRILAHCLWQENLAYGIPVLLCEPCFYAGR